MPRTKNPMKYPENYGPMLLSAYASKANGLRIPCNTASEAHALRRNLYAYVTAVEHSEELHKVSDEMRESARMHQVRITIELGPKPALYLLNRAYTPENIALTRAFEGLEEGSELTDTDREERDLAQQIIEAAGRGDFAEVERLEALSGLDSPGGVSAEPGDKPPEPEPTSVVDDSPFARFLINPEKEAS